MAYSWQSGGDGGGATGGGGMPHNSPRHSQQQQQQMQLPVGYGNMITAGDGQHSNSYPQRHSIDSNSMSISAGMPGQFNAPGMPSSFSNDAELSALLSNYEPSALANIAASAQHQRLQREAQLSNYSRSGVIDGSGMFMNNAASNLMQQQAFNANNAAAAAAVAAYGHLNYQAGMSDGQSRSSSLSHPSGMMNGVGVGSQPMPRSMSDTPWTQQQSAGQGGGAGQNARRSDASRNVAAPTTSGGYEGDASNSSSAQTPGVSSGEDSGSGKRRRAKTDLATLPEVPSSYDQMMSSGNANQAGYLEPRQGNQDHHSRYNTHNNSISAESSATAPSMLGGIGALQPGLQPLSRPLLQHRRSHSGSQIDNSIGHSIGHETGAKDDAGGDFGRKGLQQFRSASTANINFPFSGQSYAASHPPGAGNQEARGEENGGGGGGGHTNSNHAATDFTKRKGWPTRIVDELLDFVHVLDANGCILFAASSVGTLTGWKLEELREKPIRDFIHPHDAASFDREFSRCFAERSEMTMYYRFRKKPQTADDKQRVHDQRIATTANQPQSESTSEGESSSNQDLQPKNSTTFADGMLNGNARAHDVDGDDDATGFRDDNHDAYVLFEVVGHPYLSADELHATRIDIQADATTEESKEAKKTSDSATRPRSLSNKSLKRPLKKSSSATDVQKAVHANGTQAVGDKVPKGVQCFFCSGRVYPTKNVGMLDSFLELKLENERLRIMLSELSTNNATAVVGDAGSSDGGGRNSLDELHLAYPIEYPESLDGRGSTGHGGVTGDTSIGDGMTNKTPSADATTFAGRRITAQHKEVPYGTPDGVDDEEGQNVSPHTFKLERSMTNASPLAEDSDEAMSPSMEADEAKRRKKKSKQQDEGDYVCTDCGRVDSPEWRKGPLGPKTLCNACGLRWAKKIKRSGGDPNAVSRAGAAAKAQQLAAAQQALKSDSQPSGGSGTGGSASQDVSGPYGSFNGSHIGGQQLGADNSGMQQALSASAGAPGGGMYGQPPPRFDSVMHPGPSAAAAMNFIMQHGNLGPGPALNQSMPGGMPAQMMEQHPSNFMFQNPQQQSLYASQRSSMPNPMMSMGVGADGANDQPGGTGGGGGMQSYRPMK